MTPFEHLAVLISIILGLGVTHLLTSVHHLVMARARVRFYWLPLLWTVLMFIAQIEWWWAVFALRQQVTWNFFYFLFILLSPVALYLASAFALPSCAGEGLIDLRAHYYLNRRWFFLINTVSLIFDGLRRTVQAGHWRDLGGASNLVSAALLVSLAVSRRPWYHGLISLLVAAVFLYFIVVAALQLV
jgi:hypothetical protein